MGYSALWVLGIVFLVLGGIYTPLGVIFLVTGQPVLKIVGLAFTPVGTVLLILALVFFSGVHRKKKQAEALVAEGRYVWAEIMGWSFNTNVRINGRYCVNLRAGYMDGRGCLRVFKSPNLKILPHSEFLGRRVKVYYGDNNFRNYYMDVDAFLEDYRKTCVEAYQEAFMEDRDEY